MSNFEDNRPLGTSNHYDNPYIGFVLFIIVMFGFGYLYKSENGNFFKQEKLRGTIVETRIHNSSYTETNGGASSVVGGAIVGGLIAGPIGTVVGSVAGLAEGPKQTHKVSYLSSCSLIIEVGDGNRASFWEHASRCIDYRQGDKVDIIKKLAEKPRYFLYDANGHEGFPIS